MKEKLDSNSDVRIPDRLRASTGFLVRAMTTLGRKIASQNSFSVRVPHFSILVYLDENGPCSQKRLCEVLDTDKGDMAKFIAILEGEGLIQRSTDQVDKRQQVIQLSRKGQASLPECQKGISAVGNEFLKGLSKNERVTLNKLLLKALSAHQERFR